MNHNISAAVMYPKPYQKPRMPILIGGYVDKVLQRAATAGDGWLTYFYRPADFKKSWDKIRGFAKEAGKDPDSPSTPRNFRSWSGCPRRPYAKT